MCDYYEDTDSVESGRNKMENKAKQMLVPEIREIV